MLTPFKDYDTTRVFSEFPKLPKGGYVMKIMGVAKKKNSTGEYLQIGMDVAEGQYKDFYTKQYTNDTRSEKKWGCNFLLNIPKDDGSEKDGWTKSKFKTFTVALEESNSGYHFDWDENKWKGKLIGGLFNEREYKTNNGNIGKAANFEKVCKVEDIRTGNFKIPEDKLLEKPAESSDGFVNVPEGISEELPFN